MILAEASQSLRAAPPVQPAGVHELRRVVIFTSQRSFSVRKGIAALAREFPWIEWLLIEHAPRRRVTGLLRNQWRHLRRNGPAWIPYTLADITSTLRARVFGRPPLREDSPGQAYELRALERTAGLALHRFADLHGADCLEEVRRFQPDLGLSVAAPILRAALFGIPRLGTINLHKGRLPDYRGMPPAFWELYRGERSVGCSIHRVESGLDTGELLLSAEVPRAKYSTVRGLQLELDELGVRLTCEALRQIDEGRARWRPQTGRGTLYTKPTLRQQSELRRRLEPPAQGPGLRRALKDLFFRLYVAWRFVPGIVLGLLGRQRVVVLLYHRVNDDMRDDLTVGLEQFDRQIEWISSRFETARIEEVLAGRVNRRSRRPIVAVTFDDGYADNHEKAAPILERHRVPAAFFVSTARIENPAGFDHDLKRTGRALPTMTWDQVRDLHARGFTIGSHTANHIDCGKADLETLRRELVESRDALRDQLGLEEIIFAFPFGRRHNMTVRAQSLARELGYAGCLSAYGGCNRGPIDADNVLRLPIGSEYSFWAFRARLEGFG